MDDSPPSPFGYVAMHRIVREAFSPTRLDNLSLACGVESWKESGPQVITGTGMYSGVAYNCFDVLADLGLRILDRLVEEIVQIRGAERARSAVVVSDVKRARERLRCASSVSIQDDETLAPCPSSRLIQRGRRAPGEPAPLGRFDPRQRMIDVHSQRYAQLLEAETARDSGNERGAARRALIALHREGMECLYLPYNHFNSLTKWAFTGRQTSAPTLTAGAKSLLQCTVEQALQWVLKSTAVAVAGIASRRAISGNDIATMHDVLKQREGILQGELPSHDGLDSLDAAFPERRPNSARGAGAVRGRLSSRGRSRGRGARSRSPRLPEPDEEDEDDDSD